MTGRLAGKTAIITGASSGMGRVTAELFAAEGAAVALVDIGDEAGEQAAAAITADGGEARYWHLDVSDERRIETVFGEVVSRWGALDILVNCAGVIGPDKPTHEVTEAEFDALFAVDVKGVFFCTKHAVRHMIGNRRGSIVNFSSIYGLIGNDEFTTYHVAKGAVTMQTRQDAATYGRYGIRVNSVHPGTVRTPLVDGIAAEYPGGLPAYEEMMTANQSLRRLGLPIDVAYGVLYLASDEAGWVTGVNLPLDGGYTAR
ncbi:short-chain dehydrogenase [Prauserella marina]|uniref:NAD(P)-dependent dehydrogenase, short-chain alcohol dehydrogenase family n=1 Tax=Prauserella marina TaxID=530584 RepID=A0A222VMX0_9PSEU|nr:SDR family oxidoreductase [Prauserella marina]ASR35247.1 short-chain dehydrogenase [Prauserella marina]PWV84977.1 NAD(P)-dependent dehydrogenase (short-subunit alcohol dehydrogenase family) [Prauserella marina]SDC07814.1 NAD(P)-dependent dehydrogenase, short-chain alcohol dehydrogenase family [Prauserella marina]